jgi:hypothetical protein
MATALALIRESETGMTKPCFTTMRFVFKPLLFNIVNSRTAIHEGLHVVENGSSANAFIFYGKRA